jgi:integrase/recombinase XerC
MTTWHVLIAAYCGYLTALGRPPTTVGLRRWQLRHFSETVGKPADTVTYDDVIGFFAAGRWAAETRRSYRSGLRGFFDWAQRQGRLIGNPVASMPQFSVPRAAARPCPDEVYQSALEKSDARESLILRLAAEAGLRRAEIAQVHRDDVLGGPGCYDLLVHGKGAHERVVPLRDGLAKELLEATGWVFPSQRGSHLTPRAVGTMASLVLGPGVTLHQLRHRFATRAYRGSRNLRAVQQLLGHSSLAITERYVDCDEAERRAAMMSAA